MSCLVDSGYRFTCPDCGATLRIPNGVQHFDELHPERADELSKAFDLALETQMAVLLQDGRPAETV
jgi:hypothetical protein